MQLEAVSSRPVAGYSGDVTCREDDRARPNLTQSSSDTATR